MTVLSAYALLYLWFIITSFIPAPEGNWISSAVPFEPSWAPDFIAIRLMFVLFLPGYVVAWTNEGVAGAIFILWWVVMWGMDLLVMAPAMPDGGGMGIAMGLPVFVLGVLFLKAWFRKRSPHRP
ncbi:MAG: hypothetical protein QF681_00355 [Vicinamibacterales bacterium]|nr:hypothetical protein [Vicinamibacterales bacterium]